MCEHNYPACILGMLPDSQTPPSPPTSPLSMMIMMMMMIMVMVDDHEGDIERNLHRTSKISSSFPLLSLSYLKVLLFCFTQWGPF